MKYKKLLILIKPYIKWIILALLLSSIEALTTYLSPKYIQKVIDIVVPTNDFYRLKEIIFYLLFLESASLVSTFVLKYIFAMISNEYILSVKQKIIDTCFYLDGEKVDSTKKTLITIMNNDVYYLQSIITNLLPQLIIDIVSIIAIFIVLYNINHIIIVIICLFYPILIITQYIFNKKI